MSKDNKNKQRKPKRRDLIERAKKEWEEKANQLAEEKEQLGYKDVPYEDFLALSPDDEPGTVKRSKLISLQDQYKEHIQHREHILAEDNVIDEFNKNHAIVHVGQTYILTEKINTLNVPDFSLESRQSLRHFYEEETIICIDSVERPKADLWLKSPRRRKFNGILFDPTTTESKNGYYNLWKGFARQPKKGECPRYWIHVQENICSGNKEQYLYLRKWLAYIFQHPDKVHTALVLCGSQGVGKNSFVEPLGVLLGSHYAPLSSIAELVSNFNYHLKNAVLIHANEALWGGNKKEIGTVKAMITEETCLIEGKGKDRIVVRNFKHLILSSNEEWPVHLDPDDRRFFVLRVGEKYKEDHNYFKALHEELNQGGYEALLYDLLDENISGFDPRQLPSNPDSFSIKMLSTGSAIRYLHDALSEGGFSIGEDKIPMWQAEIPKDDVYQDYVAWCKKNSEHSVTNALFGKALKRVSFSVKESRPGNEHRNRIRCYKFPSLIQARDEFSRAFKETAERIFDDET